MEPNTHESIAVPSSHARRLSATCVGLGAVLILGVAAWLSPSTDGIGTHRQLGLPVCGWIVAADIPCPTCGMTTAFSYAVRGQFVPAFRAQPFGMLVAVGVAVTGVIAFMIALCGRPKSAFWYRWMTTKTLLCICALAAFAWVYKILVHRGWIS